MIFSVQYKIVHKVFFSVYCIILGIFDFERRCRARSIADIPAVFNASNIEKHYCFQCKHH